MQMENLSEWEIVSLQQLQIFKPSSIDKKKICALLSVDRRVFNNAAIEAENNNHAMRYT